MSTLMSMPPEQPEGASSADAPLLAEDQAYFETLRGAGLLPDLMGEELLRTIAIARAGSKPEKSAGFRMDVLQAHYAAAGDRRVSESRRQVDRFFSYDEDEPTTASQLLGRIAALTPELSGVALERIGDGPDATFILRAGEDIAALLDDYEESLDTGEVDIRALDADGPRPSAMVTIRGLMGAINVLLARREVRERFVPLRSDARREVYVAVPLTEAIELVRADLLEEVSAEDVMELGNW